MDRKEAEESQGPSSATGGADQAVHGCDVISQLPLDASGAQSADPLGPQEIVKSDTRTKHGVPLEDDLLDGGLGSFSPEPADRIEVQAPDAGAERWNQGEERRTPSERKLLTEFRRMAAIIAFLRVWVAALRSRVQATIARLAEGIVAGFPDAGTDSGSCSTWDCFRSFLRGPRRATSLGHLHTPLRHNLCLRSCPGRRCSGYVVCLCRHAPAPAPLK